MRTVHVLVSLDYKCACFSTLLPEALTVIHVLLLHSGSISSQIHTMSPPSTLSLFAFCLSPSLPPSLFPDLSFHSAEMSVL